MSLRVLHLLASPVFSGPAETVLQLALAQRTLGHQVQVAVDQHRREVSSEELAAPRFESQRLLAAMKLELSVKSNPLGMLRDLRALKTAKGSFDVVHCHFSHDHQLARIAGLPCVIRSIHHPRSARWSTPRADGFTAPTEELARQLLGRDVMILPALIDSSFAQSPHQRGARIGMVSTFQPSRRHALALAAFAEVKKRTPHATLDLIGDGALEEQLRSSAGESVFFRGYLSGAAFVEALQALDELWVLGLGNDYSARIAAQARACGTRVVSVDEGALEKWADVLVEPTPEAIAAAALSGERRELRVESNTAIAQRVVDLYVRAASR